MIKGCFNLIKLIITTIFVLIILFPCGGLNYIKSLINSYQHPQKVENQIKTDKFGDFSKTSNDFQLIKSLEAFGIKAIVAENKKTEQKMAVIDSGWTFNITKKDIISNNLEDQLKKISLKFPYSPVKLNKLDIIKKGSFKAFNQNIPYVRVKVSLTGNQKNNFEGIIGVVTYPNNKNNLVVSYNDSNKYDQKIAEKFFKNIKIKANSDI